VANITVTVRISSDAVAVMFPAAEQ